MITQATSPTLGIQTTYELIKQCQNNDVVSIIKKYLTLPEVVHKAKDTWSLKSFDNAIKKRLRDIASTAAVNKPPNMFATTDRPSFVNSSTYRSRYSAKVRYEPTLQHEPPPVMVQYELKPWKPGSKKPVAPQQTSNKPPLPIRPQVQGCLEWGQMLDEMMWEHPTYSLDLGGLKENIESVVADSDSSHAITECIQQAVREALSVKRRAQELIGKYISDMFYPRPATGGPRPKDTQPVTNSTDIAIQDLLCPRITSTSIKDEGSDNIEDGHGEGNKTCFLQAFLRLLYSGNMPILRLQERSYMNTTPTISDPSTAAKEISKPRKPSVSATVQSFIYRLQDLGLLPVPDKQQDESCKMPFTTSSIVRSAATQLSADLKRHYKTLQDWLLTGRNNASSASEKVSHPSSTGDTGAMVHLLHKRAELHPTLKLLIDHTDDRPLTQADQASDWLQGQGPGSLIRNLIAPVAHGALLPGKKSKGVNTYPVVSFDPEGIRAHVNNLRAPDFDPRSYTQKDYALRGSVKTDGHRLQTLAFKLRELSSVRYKRYSVDVLPDSLLSTTAGTDDHLTEVRNVFKSKEDVERLLGCPADQRTIYYADGEAEGSGAAYLQAQMMDGKPEGKALREHFDAICATTRNRT
ncbi:hypothetical protein BG004_005704 [Podila humilis]|nr:hypothetical protein BG004_005704 [Podila humilis]